MCVKRLYLILQPDTPARQTHEKYPSPSEQGLQVVIPSIDSLKLMLQLLGLTCDGQNQTLQNYMQKQPGQIENVNIVRDLLQLLKHFRRMHTDPENEGVLMLRYVCRSFNSQELVKAT